MFGSFSFLQVFLWLRVHKVLQKLTKSCKSELRHLFQCCILIPRTCPRKTPSQHPVPPPPGHTGPPSLSDFWTLRHICHKHTYFFKNVGLMLLFPVLTLSALLVAPNMRSCTVPWQGGDQTDKCWNNTGLPQNWSNHAYVNCLINVTNDKNSNDYCFASYFCCPWCPKSRLYNTMMHNKILVWF